MHKTIPITNVLGGPLMFDPEINDVIRERVYVRPRIAKSSRDVDFKHPTDTLILAGHHSRRRQQVGILERTKPHGDDLHAEVEIGIVRSDGGGIRVGRVERRGRGVTAISDRHPKRLQHLEIIEGQSCLHGRVVHPVGGLGIRTGIIGGHHVHLHLAGVA